VPDSPEARNGVPLLADAAESAVELSDTNQSWESAAGESSEDAADHPERPAQSPEEYFRPTACHRKRRGIARPVVSDPYFLLSTSAVPLSSSAASLTFPLASCLNSMVTPF
jgi:hypothetical protein